MQNQNKTNETSGRYYINLNGELVAPKGVAAPLDKQAPTHIAVSQADDADTQTLMMMLTGLHKEGYFIQIFSLAVDWLMTVRNLTEKEAMAMIEVPVVSGWWFNHFMERERMLAAALTDYYDKRIKLQPQKTEPRLKRIAVEAEVFNFWTCMHRMAMTKDTWQYRRLVDSYQKTHINLIKPYRR